MMKRYGNIFQKFEDIEFIKFAIKSASKHKTRREKVKRVLDDLDRKAEVLQKILLSGEFRPSPLNISERWDPRNKKYRTISSPRFFPDQCVHWCVVLAIKPIMMKGMYEHSCGNVPGRGRTAGVRYVQKTLKKHAKNTKWCLKMDIHHFYQSIDHEILIRKLRNKIKDEKMIDLIKVIIDSYEEGIPLGNYTSQWFANFFLQDMDHFIKQELKAPYYLRYVDDMVIIGPNKKKLHTIRKEIEKKLDEEGLKLKQNWQVFKVDDRGIDFLGFVFFHGYTKLRARNFLSLKRQAAEYRKMEHSGKPPSLHFAQSYLSRVAQLDYCSAYNIRAKYIRKNWCKKAKDVIRTEATNGDKRRKIERRNQIPEDCKRKEN